MKTNQDGKPPTAGRQVDGPAGSSRVNPPAATRVALAVTALSALLAFLAVVLLVLNRSWACGR